jgi:hypothetical protein
MVSETKLSPEQHQKLSRIVYKESGVVLNEKKYNLLVSATRTESVNVAEVESKEYV